MKYYFIISKKALRLIERLEFKDNFKKFAAKSIFFYLKYLYEYKTKKFENL